jgi:GT2 family glycosyltransferase
MTPALSIIIPTWNGLSHLPACLAALAPQCAEIAGGVEILLIDNGSRDGTAAWIGQAYPKVTHVRLPENIGFAGGVNTGLRRARGGQILLFNDDAFAEPGFLSALMAAARAHPHVGAVAGILTFAHKPAMVASAGIRSRRDGLALDLWAGRSVADLPSTAQPILGASGGAALLNRAMLADIGLLEGRFFNYLEDVDLAWRARLRGWDAVVAPAARARHVYSATSRQGSPFKQRLLGRNRIAAIVRCFPDRLLRECLPSIVAYDLLACGYALLTGQHAIVQGRSEAVRMLPSLLEQRRKIQARRSASVDSFAAWLEPPSWPWQTLAEQRRLDALLAERQTANEVSS